VWWQRAHPPFWRAKTVAETSPRFKKTLVGTAGAAVLLFVVGLTGDSQPKPDTVDTAAVSADDDAVDPAATATAATTPNATSTAVPPTTTPPPATTEEAVLDADEGSALALLGTLAVKGRAPKTGYDREQFGQAWFDTDRNGCDTRNDILGRDLSNVTFKAGTRSCKVLSGTLADPLTGRMIAFTSDDGMAVQIDHVVALSDAWQKGAAQWDPGKRLAFANDPINLLAVDGPTNGSKSDSDAASWLPPNKAFRCPMVARQVAVKAKYGLWITAAERDAIARVLSSCPGQVAPTGGTPTTAPVPLARRSAAVAPAPLAPAAPPPPAPMAPPAGALDSNYGTCKAAKAAGAGPYYAGTDPEYDWYRDQDSDGMVCD
jgi:hypothetical protein